MRWFLLILGALILAGALCSGCTSDSQGKNFVFPAVPTDTEDKSSENQDPGTESIVDSGVNDKEEPANLLAGRWGGLINMEVAFKGLPLLGTIEGALRYFYLIDLYESDDGTLRTRERLCALCTKADTEQSVGVQSDTEPGFVEFDGVHGRALHIDSSSPGTRFTSDVVYQMRGADVCDDQNDPLPPAGSGSLKDETACDGDCDGGACDQDQDGHPGITSRLRGAGGMIDCDVYYAHRWWNGWEGVVVDSDTLTGGFWTIGTEQSVLAASNVLCAANTPVNAGACPAGHYFKLVRLQDDADCVDVMALTDCDESTVLCDGNEVLPLDPKPDESVACD